MNEIAILINLGISAILGGIVGIERETERKPAGLRTHMLVSVSATALVWVSTLVNQEMIRSLSPAVVATDPNRIVQAIVVGISFIGAGTIVKSSEKLEARHLSTAASILFAAVLGILVALDVYIVAVVLTVAAAVINRIVGIWEEKILNTNGSEEQDADDES